MIVSENSIWRSWLLCHPGSDWITTGLSAFIWIFWSLSPFFRPPTQHHHSLSLTPFTSPGKPLQPIQFMYRVLRQNCGVFFQRIFRILRPPLARPATYLLSLGSSRNKSSSNKFLEYNKVHEKGEFFFSFFILDWLRDIGVRLLILFFSSCKDFKIDLQVKVLLGGETQFPHRELLLHIGIYMGWDLGKRIMTPAVSRHSVGKWLISYVQHGKESFVYESSSYVINSVGSYIRPRSFY